MEEIMLYIREKENKPIGAILAQRDTPDAAWQVVVSLCHPTDYGQFVKREAWKKLRGKILSDRFRRAYSTEELLSKPLSYIFSRGGVPHLAKYYPDYLDSTRTQVVEKILTKLSGGLLSPPAPCFAYLQLCIIDASTEKFRKSLSGSIKRMNK